MRYITAAVFYFCAFFMQQKPVTIFSEQPFFADEYHAHTDKPLALDEILEVIFTGQVNHAHEHNDHGEKNSHSHSHEHTSPYLVSSLEFLTPAFIFNLVNSKSPWPSISYQNLAEPFQSEILRPPIVQQLFQIFRLSSFI